MEDTAQDGGPRSCIRARFGTFYLSTEGEDGRSQEELRQEVVEALRADARVDEALAREPLMRPPWWVDIWPTTGVEKAAELVAGDDMLYAARFEAPIQFRAHVPIKNQPVFGATDVVPSDDYFVVWDGCSIVVAWEASDADVVARAGGHVIAEILGEAASGISASIHVQACTAGCTHLFSHTDLLVYPEPGAGGYEWTESETWSRTFEVTAPQASSVPEQVYELFLGLHSSIELFGEMKNAGQRILALVHAAEATRAELNRALYKVFSMRQGPARGRIRGEWEFRRWRAEARVLLSRLWLLLGAVEDLRRWWSGQRWRLEQELEETGQGYLFEGDNVHDDLAVERVDLGLLRAAAEEAGARLDSTALTRATAAAGLAAVVGVLIGHFL